MTFFHFVNCSAITFLPLYIICKYSGVYEYIPVSKCVQTSFMYLSTQLVKMIILATFFPDSFLETNWLLSEVIKSSMDIFDYFVIYYRLEKLSGSDGFHKISITGLGWSGAEILCTRSLMLWTGARGFEFDWTFLLKSFESNLIIIHYLTVSALLWLLTRRDFKKPKYHPNIFVWILLVLCLFKHLFLQQFHHISSLVYNCIYSFSLALFSIGLFLTLEKSLRLATVQ